MVHCTISYTIYRAYVRPWLHEYDKNIRWSKYTVGDDQAAKLVDDKNIDCWRRSTEPLLEYLQDGLHSARCVFQRHRNVTECQNGVVQDQRRLPGKTPNINVRQRLPLWYITTCYNCMVTLLLASSAQLWDFI